MTQKVTFEIVNPIGHPEYYNDEVPAVSAAEVPDEHWRKVEREGDGVQDQYNGLLRLMADGELIRNPQLWYAEVPEMEWKLVEHG